MSNLVSRDSNALRLLMTEDLYILPEKGILIQSGAEKAAEVLVQQTGDLPVQKPAEAEKSKEFFYLGENNKYFLILFDDPKHQEISSLHKETLLKIMSAKGLELRDLAILNLHQYPGVSFSELKEFFSFNKIALFGIDPQRIALAPVSSNQVEKQQGARLLCTFSIDEMISDTAKKREFWNVMKDF
ncbi:MAG: hypothetical protein WC220_10900 [Pedobacter sp.]|jgi:hypothetical protein